MLIFFQWLFGHLLIDFVLQTKKMVQHKRTHKAASWLLYLHCALHAGVIYLLSPDKTLWLIPVIVFITHYLIDLWKLYQTDNLKSFLIDQVLHVLVLLILWLVFYKPHQWFQINLLALLQNKTGWIVATGYLFIIFPLSFLLGYGTQRWRKEAEAGVDRSAVSLSEAGKWIGIFERILVYTFVITTHFEGIGFLIAAKSILRFNDIKGDNVRKEAEYVLIGTLMSFAASILTGLVVTLIVKHP